MFQRINREEGSFTWGFAYDWLFDDYYSNFHFGQWRVKAAWEFDPCNELGIQVALPEHGSYGHTPRSVYRTARHVTFKPITQGYLYWKHTWDNDASLTGRFGVAERPGEFVFGGRKPRAADQELGADGRFQLYYAQCGGWRYRPDAGDLECLGRH